VGSRPDGWWRDRRGAAMRLIAGLDSLSRRGVPASALQLPGDTWHPRMIAIVEGQARGVPGTDRVDVVDSPGVGDDAVVDSVHECATAGYSVTVVTSDRALQGRVRDAGGRAVGSSWATDLLAPG
ncbi:MAG: NTP pyrophosphohydrolase, partial [Demequina sp.]